MDQKSFSYFTDNSFWQVATAMLLLVLSGPVKALAYLVRLLSDFLALFIFLHYLTLAHMTNWIEWNG